MGHDHSHAAGRAEDRRRLLLVLVITGTVLVAELLGAWLARLAGVARRRRPHGHRRGPGIVLALGASYVATRPAVLRSTFGWHRAEILAALLNAAVLLGVCAFLAYAGIARLGRPAPGGAGADWSCSPGSPCSRVAAR